jgi:putative membrane protein
MVSLGIAFSASGQGTTTLAGPDRTFVDKAAKGGIAEVELGKVAQQRASDAKVKQFAERMVTDHGKANDELKGIATRKGVNLPSSPDKETQQMSEKLQRLQGPAFDREYMKHMVSDHKKDVAEFDKQAKSGKDADVKQFAAKTLPIIQDHLKMAQEIEPSTKGGSGK